MYTSRSLTPEEIIENERWEKSGMILVLKDFTILNNGNSKLCLIKAGTISTKYEFCYFHFIDENGNNQLFNIAPCIDNPDYFTPITMKEIRKRKLLNITEHQLWYDEFIKDTEKF